ncbi:MAG: hypothetical protein CSA62_15235 [Planctomycetota bacterium]|nr:MAG: hypothetical protein CSA62_15235 [Planctomycetota bacterium]
MGPLQQRISDDTKAAMKARDKERVQLLRMLVNDLQQEQYKTGKSELKEGEELAVLRKSAKMRGDSIQAAEDSGREEFAAKERRELEIIESYLPKMMDAEETQAKVQELLQELGISERKEQGRFMKEWMSRYKATSDGKLVNQLLGKLLS